MSDHAVDPPAPSAIPAREFRARRARLLRELDGAVGLLFAGSGEHPLLGAWRPEPSFLYLTGVTDEPGAALLLDPGAPDPRRCGVLFLRPLNPEAERYTGPRDVVGSGLRSRLGFECVLRTTALARTLMSAARRARVLACLHPPAMPDAPVSPDLAMFRKVAERLAGVSISDRTQVLASMRSVKSAAERALMARAIDATGAGFDAVLRRLGPGVREAELGDVLDRAFRAHGADGVAFNPIVASGRSGTVLHAMGLAGTVRDGELVVVDAGAAVGGYAADVTRTLPASGRFTPEQRRLYEVVLAAADAGIRAARPGAWLHDVDRAARRVIDRAGLADAFVHDAGHHLGLEVHDASPDEPLRAGAVITVEPGIYLPERSLGIRIEDDVLVTARGGRILSRGIPRTPAEIEAAMRRGPASPGQDGRREASTPDQTSRARRSRSATASASVER